MPLQLNLFGGFEVRRQSGAAVVLPRRKAQALLAYLAVRSGQTHRRDTLAALLWGDATDEQARHSLRQALFAIRQALPPHEGEILDVGSDAVGLRQAAAEVDVAAFEQLLKRGTAEALGEACALYRGEFLEGLGVQETAFEEWLTSERERLRELAVGALTTLLAQHEREGSVGQAVNVAARLLSLDPLQEAVQRTLMRLYARQGRRGAALRQYQVCIDVLQRELGVEPEASTRQLYQEILEGSSGADPAATTVLPAISSGQPDSSEVASTVFTPPTPLVGRTPAIAALRQLWNQTRQGRGQLAVILGEAGTGKSRLVAELVGDAAGSGGRVLLGRAHYSEQILAFGPWVDALRSGRAIADLLVAPQANTPWVAELARLFPELGGPIRALADAEDYVRLFEAMAQVIGRLAADGPLLMVLEDVHWADEMTLRLLAFVSRRVAEWPVLLVTTARSEHIIDAPLLRRALVELNAQAGVLSLGLSPLSEPETVMLVRSLCRAGTEEASVRRLGEQIWRVSEGNPFMVVETMRARSEDESGEDGALRTPGRVRDVIAARLERLSGRGRQLAALASAVGQEFDFALLDRAAAIGTHAAAEAVEELVARRLLHAVGEHLDFTHERIREVAYDQLIAPRRTLLHAQLADAIEALHAENLEPHTLTLGVHFRKAQRWEKAVHYLREAGLTAARRSAHRQAMLCFEQALDALRHLPNRRELLEQAIDLRIALRHSSVAVGAIAQTVDHLRAAEEAAETLGDHLRLGWVLAYRTSSHVWFGEQDQALLTGQRAVAIAGTVAEPKLRTAAQLYYGEACHGVGQYEQAAALMRQSIGPIDGDMIERGDLATQQSYIRTLAVCSLAELGKFAEGVGLGSEAIRLAEVAGRTNGLAHACFAVGFLHLRQGDVQRARSVLERGAGLCQQREVPLLAAALGGMLGYGYALSGDVARGIPLLDDALRFFSVMRSESSLVVLLGEAELLAGHRAEARALAERALALTRARSERGIEGWALRLQADSLGCDAPGEADTAYASALARAQELCMEPLEAHCYLGRGRLRHQLGADDQARVDLSAAVQRFRSKQMSLWLAAAEEDLRSAAPA